MAESLTTEIDVTRELLDDVVRRIVHAVQPVRIVLFGSAVRGALGPHSDLDILVVMQDGTHRRETAQCIYRSLFDLEIPKDIVVVTESDVKDLGTNPSLVIRPALEEGRELYHARQRACSRIE
ncbi:MAG: nucleotidyltransferase domain-containing protein [Pseudomonadota bacterium]